MERRLWIGLLTGLFVGLLMTGLASAQQFGGNKTINDSEATDVSVTVNSNTMVDINPASFTWTGVDPGGVGDNNTETHNYYALQVENIGSHNITHVWFNATYPTSNPFGVGNADNTDSGNYIALSNSTSNSFQFINRVEYNATTTIVYLRDPEGALPPDNSRFVYGRIHNASNEYFWMINKSATGFCNGTATLYIGNTSHHKTQTGTSDFETGDVESFPLTIHPDDVDWGYTDIDAGPFSGYCAAISSDCSQIFLSRWNADRPFDACSNSVYAWNADLASTDPLTPGESFYMKIKAHVPYGIYEGASGTGHITAIVNTL